MSLIMPSKTKPTTSRLKRFAPLAALVMAAAVAVPAAFAANGLQTAIFAGGCFWTIERDFEQIPGVVNATSGFTGGAKAHPTYAEVSTETTGHMESVRVTFDPKRVTYAQLVDHYWRFIDPTDAGGQACDRGPSYHPAIFVNSPEQRRVAEASKAALEKGKLRGHIIVPIKDAMPFYAAEDYHQKYAQKHPMDYHMYRVGCGRDEILKRIWGSAPN
jgi:methionine-S-sulfoxide reductase